MTLGRNQVSKWRISVERHMSKMSRSSNGARVSRCSCNGSTQNRSDFAVDTYPNKSEREYPSNVNLLIFCYVASFWICLLIKVKPTTISSFKGTSSVRRPRLNNTVSDCVQTCIRKGTTARHDSLMVTAAAVWASADGWAARSFELLLLFKLRWWWSCVLELDWLELISRWHRSVTVILGLQLITFACSVSRCQQLQ